MTFAIAIERVLGHEGGYINDPDDPGGETNWGITKRFAWEYGFRGQMLEMTRKEAIVLYQAGFWDKLYCDVFKFPISFQLFDGAVHSGRTQAVRWLQRSVGALDDGIIGPKTFTAIKLADPTETGERFLSIRWAFLQTLPTFWKYENGWKNRIDRNREYLKDDLHSTR